MNLTVLERGLKGYESDRALPALSNMDDVAFADLEAGGEMGSDVLVPLLESVILFNVVQVVPPEDDRVLHLGRDDHAPGG